MLLYFRNQRLAWLKQYSELFNGRNARCEGIESVLTPCWQPVIGPYSDRLYRHYCQLGTWIPCKGPESECHCGLKLGDGAINQPAMIVSQVAKQGDRRSLDGPILVCA